MNRNDNYYNNRKRGRKRNDGRGRDGRGRNYRDRDFRKNDENRGIQRELQRNLQKFSMENELAIREYRKNVKICEICGRAIVAEDIDCALPNRETGNPAHFDCVLKQVCERERLSKNEHVVYIGQGKFAVLSFENPRDLRKFVIRRTIEWEKTDKRLEWRNEIARLFSQTR